MKLSEIYLAAARRVCRKEDFTCNTIDRISSGGHDFIHDFINPSPARKFYESLFKPRGGTSAWLEPVDFDSHEFRIIAMCFMHAIALYNERDGKGGL